MISPRAIEIKGAGRVKLLLAFGAVYFIWGSTFLAVRCAVQSMPPFLVVGVRSLAAGSILFFLVPRSRIRTLEPVHWRSALVAGSLLFLGAHGLLGWATQRTYSSVAALLLATIPCWMVILGRLHGGPAPKRRTLLGLVLGFFGVAVLVFPAHASDMNTLHPADVAALLGSAILWAGGSLYARRAPLPDHLGLSTAMQLLCGGGGLTLIAILCGEFQRLDPERITPQATFSLLYLIVFGSLITFSAYSWLLRVTDPAIVGSYAFVNPLVALLLGWLIGGELLDSRTLIGGMIIVASVGLIHFGARSPGR